MVLEEPSRGSDVLLVSDLNDSLFDVASLEQTLRRYKRDGIHLRIVALRPTVENRGFFVSRVGQERVRRAGRVRRRAHAAQSGRPLAGGTPWALIGLISLLAAGARRERASLRTPRVEDGMRARVAAPLAVALLLVAALLAGLAHQVGAWHDVMRSDDVRFVTAPVDQGLWAAPAGPGAGVAGDLLGLSDDVRFRKAERLYVRGHLPGDDVRPGEVAARGSRRRRRSCSTRR